MSHWAMRGGTLIIYPQVGTDDVIKIRGRAVAPTDLDLDSEDLIFGDSDDGLNHMRESLLLWRVAARMATRNRELSQNLEFRAQQAERELYVAMDGLSYQEKLTTGILKVSDG